MIIEQLILALLYVPMALGVTLSFRIAKFPDLTIDGSFATGASICAVWVNASHPEISLLASLVLGGFAGLLTALIHIYLKTSKILSGIVVMFGLYSINIMIMGTANLPMRDIVKQEDYPTALSFLQNNQLLIILFLLFLTIFLILTIFGFFRTEKGLYFIAQGQSKKLITDLGRDNNIYIIVALMCSNALIGLSGGLIASYQGFANVTMGSGQLITGLAVLYIGQIFTSYLIKKENQFTIIISAIAGIVIFQLLYMLSYSFGLPSYGQRIFTAAIVLIPAVLQRLFKGKFELEEII